ncbi:MAG: SPOR domain-containing protein [Psychromonas sp.]
MAPVNKNKPVKPKKRAPRKRPVRNKKQPQKGFPIVAVLGIVLLTAFIGYFMFAVEKPAEPVVVVNKEPPRKEEELPEKPQPKWEYEDLLKTQKMEVEIPEVVEQTRPYQMQCGSFRQQNDAESLKVRIAFQGLNSEVRKTGSWYRVILGPYERKRPAEKDRHKLQRAKINGCQIWLWR